MTCRVLGKINPKLSLQLRTYGDKGAETEDEHMDNLRLILAVWMADYISSVGYDMDADPEFDALAMMVTAQPLYELGRVKVVDGIWPSLAMYSYINYTRVTSEWAKKAYPGTTVQITARIIQAVDDFSNVVNCHTLVVYF